MFHKGENKSFYYFLGALNYGTANPGHARDSGNFFGNPLSQSAWNYVYYTVSLSVSYVM